MPKSANKRHKPRTSKYSSHQEHNSTMIEKIEKHFSKVYSFAGPTYDESKWCLPSANDLFQSAAWTDENLATHKLDLNGVKSLLNDKDIVKWRQHTQNVNLAGRVVQYLRNKFHPELCTQAWCKFYEIVCSFPLVPFEQSFQHFNSVHLCEAPGAFVAALNHYLTLNHPHVSLTWLASTLNPYYEGNRVSSTITDDRFIYPTLDHWDFGVDNTGNIFTRSNRQHLITRTECVGPIHLVTADGSIDCQNDPSEQEGTVAMLHLTEVITALHILAPGGNLVIKMFTCFEHSSVCLLYLLNCTFTSVKVFKPGTSKMGNSEVYVVALQYSGNDSILEHLAKIQDSVDNGNTREKALFGLDSLPQSFMRQMTECCGYFKDLQIDAIKENLQLFENMDHAQRISIETTKSIVASSFVQRFGLDYIPNESSIVGTKNISKFCVQLKPWQVGSFNNRMENEHRPFLEKLAQLESCFHENLQEIGGMIQYSTVFDNVASSREIELAVVTGKEFSTCFNSRFCQASVLKLWHDIIGCITDKSGLKAKFSPDFLDENFASSILHHINQTGIEWSSISVLAEQSSCTDLARNLEALNRPTDVTKSANNLVSITGKLFIVDVRYGPNHWGTELGVNETARHLQSFCSAIEEFQQHWIATQESQENCALLMFTNIPLTRIGVGVLYILNQAFRKVSLHTVPTATHPVEMYFCQEYARPIPSDVLFNIRLHAKIESTTILEIVPIVKLLDNSFGFTVHQFNCHALLHNMFRLIQILKELPSEVNNEVIPK